MALPEEMMKGLEEFTRFHDQNSNKTRKLTWQVRGRAGGPEERSAPRLPPRLPFSGVLRGCCRRLSF